MLSKNARTTFRNSAVLRRRPVRTGLTLAELVVVLLILVGLATLVVPMMTQTSNSAQLDATYQTMLAVRNAIMGQPNQPGYYQDMKGLPIPLPPNASSFSLTYYNGVAAPVTEYRAGAGLPWQTLDLFQNPTTIAQSTTTTFDPYTKKGWRGPYMNQLAGSFAANGQVLDSYSIGASPGSPIVIDWPPTSWTPPTGTTRDQYVRLVSFGADGLRDSFTGSYWSSNIWDSTQINTNSYTDDLIVYLRVSPNPLVPQSGPWTNYNDLKSKNSK